MRKARIKTEAIAASYKYVYSPFVILGALWIFVYVFFPDATGLPTGLLGLVYCVIQMHPKWKDTPDLVHNILIMGGIIILMLSAGWFVHLYMKATKKI